MRRTSVDNYILAPVDYVRVQGDSCYATQTISEAGMTTASAFERGPFLSAALICEKVLLEQDGVKSAIRIIDRIIRTVPVAAVSEQMEPFEHDFVLFISLKSGEARGTHVLEVRFLKPSGESPTPLTQSVLLEGESDRGVDIVAGMKVKFDQAGLYWFIVSIDGTRLTQVPFRVVYMPQIMQTGGSRTNPPPGANPSGS